MGADPAGPPTRGKALGILAGAAFAAAGVAIVLVGGLLADRRTAEPSPQGRGAQSGP